MSEPSLAQTSPLIYFPGIIGAIASAAAVVIGAINKRAVGEVKTELVSVKATGESTHTLSNSARGDLLLNKVELLQALSVQAHRLAEITKESADAAAAVACDVKVAAAKTEYQKHLTQQAVVDSKSKEGT